MSRSLRTGSRPARLWHLFRFHSGAGARVALRANGIVGASVVFVFGLDMDALAHLRTAVLELVTRAAGWNARAEFAGLCVILAGTAVSRVALGATGWMRSLPVSSATSRRAAIAALCVAQAFTIAVGVLAALGAALVYHSTLDAAKLAGLVLIVVAGAALVLPVEHRAARGIALAALALAIPGRWPTDLAAALALVAADFVSGKPVPMRATRAHRRRLGAPRATPVMRWMELTVRAVPGRAIGAALLLPIVFIGFGSMIIRHNPDLDHATATRTVRVAGMLGLVSLAAGLANILVRARPAWAWARSLPWSARHRVMGDTLLIGGALVVLGACLLPLDPQSAAAVLALAAPLAAGAAASTRIGSRRHTSAAGEVVLLVLIIGAPVAFWPWTATLGLLLSPMVFAGAVRRDQRIVATRWEELHHDASGDPAWMSVA